MMYPLFDTLEWFKTEYPKAIYILNNCHHNKYYLSTINYDRLYCNNAINQEHTQNINNAIKISNPAFDPNIQNTNERFAKCNHIDAHGADAVRQVDGNIVQCTVCGATWDGNTFSINDINKAINTIIAAIQNYKWVIGQINLNDKMIDNHKYEGDMSSVYPSYLMDTILTHPYPYGVPTPSVDIKIGGTKHGEQDSEHEEQQQHGSNDLQI